MGEFISALGNPWSPDQWNITKQGAFVNRYGMRRAREFAQKAGTTVGGPKPEDSFGPRTINRFIIQKRVINNNNQGGDLVGAGSSGDGPPED